jgi:hypothetical protein
MSMTINPVSPQVGGYGPAIGTWEGPAPAAPGNAFATYAAPRVRRDTTGDMASRSEVRTAPELPPGTAALQRNVELINAAKKELKGLADRLNEDPTPATKQGETFATVESALDFVVKETKKSGLYGALQQAAVQRMKDSGCYESVVKQILEKEAAKGRPRDRAWAESWIKDQFDYDLIGQNYVPDAPYFEPAYPYSGDIMRSPFNKGRAMFYGDITGPRVQGSFAISISGQEGALLYTVRNLTKVGEESAPRPYDPKGTVVKQDDLYAEFLGVPVPGDEFIVSGPLSARADEPKMRVDYYDAGYREYVDMNVKIHQKKRLINALFNPVFHGGRISQPADLIDRAVS